MSTAIQTVCEWAGCTTTAADVEAIQSSLSAARAEVERLRVALEEARGIGSCAIHILDDMYDRTPSGRHMSKKLMIVRKRADQFLARATRNWDGLDYGIAAQWAEKKGIIGV